MTATKPFIKKGDRIKPVTARDFAKLVHQTKNARVLYRVFDNADSARVSAYNCERLNVFDGLDVAFEVETLPRGKHGVYGVAAEAKAKRRIRAPKVSEVLAAKVSKAPSETVTPKKVVKKAAPAKKVVKPVAKKAAPAKKAVTPKKVVKPVAKKAAPAKKAAGRKVTRRSAA